MEDMHPTVTCIAQHRQLDIIKEINIFERICMPQQQNVLEIKWLCWNRRSLTYPYESICPLPVASRNVEWLKGKPRLSFIFHDVAKHTIKWLGFFQWFRLNTMTFAISWLIFLYNLSDCFDVLRRFRIFNSKDACLWCYNKINKLSLTLCLEDEGCEI